MTRACQIAMSFSNDFSYQVSYLISGNIVLIQCLCLQRSPFISRVSLCNAFRGRWLVLSPITSRLLELSLCYKAPTGCHGVHQVVFFSLFATSAQLWWFPPSCFVPLLSCALTVLCFGLNKINDLFHHRIFALYFVYSHTSASFRASLLAVHL